MGTKNMLKTSQRFPIIIPLLALTNAVVFSSLMYLNNCPSHETDCVFKFLKRFSFEPILSNPQMGPLDSALERMGALQSDLVVNERQAWRMLTCIWLHSGLIHLVINTVGLLVVGIGLERKFGLLKVGSIYVLSGFSGSLLSAIFVRSQYIVGASGASCGLMGSALSSLIVNWYGTQHRFSTITKLIGLNALYFGIGLTPHTNNFVHLGGFVIGFLLGLVLLMKPQEAWRSKESLAEDQYGPEAIYRFSDIQRLVQFFALLACVAGHAVAMGVLYKKLGLRANCTASYCKYFSCIPSPFWSCR